MTLLQPILDRLDIMPGPLSQTTSVWPLVYREVAEQIIGLDAEHSADSPTIQVVGERTWEDVVEEVLRDRAELWERLADE